MERQRESVLLEVDSKTEMEREGGTSKLPKFVCGKWKWVGEIRKDTACGSSWKVLHLWEALSGDFGFCSKFGRETETYVTLHKAKLASWGKKPTSQTVITIQKKSKITATQLRIIIFPSEKLGIIKFFSWKWSWKIYDPWITLINVWCFVLSVIQESQNFHDYFHERFFMIPTITG